MGRSHRFGFENHLVAAVHFVALVGIAVHLVAVLAADNHLAPAAVAVRSLAVAAGWFGLVMRRRYLYFLAFA